MRVVYLSGQKGQPSMPAQTHARIHSMTTRGSCLCGTVLIVTNISHLLGVVVIVEKFIALASRLLQRHPALVTVGNGAQCLSAIRRCGSVDSR